MSTRPQLLFIVDRDDAVRIALYRLMSAVGWEVRSFASSDACYEAALRQPPTCLLADLYPEGLNALELHRALRARNVDCPLVILTAHCDHPLAARAESLGAAAVLEKPCDSHKIEATLQRAMMC